MYILFLYINLQKEVRLFMETYATLVQELVSYFISLIK